jgi:hypothetical protein
MQSEEQANAEAVQPQGAAVPEAQASAPRPAVGADSAARATGAVPAHTTEGGNEGAFDNPADAVLPEDQPSEPTDS